MKYFLLLTIYLHYLLLYLVYPDFSKLIMLFFIDLKILFCYNLIMVEIMNYKSYIKINNDNLQYNINYLKNNYNYKYYIFDVSNNAFNHGMYLIKFLNDTINYLYVNSFNDIKLIRKYNKEIPIIFESNWSIDNILDFINNDVILVINSLEELKMIAKESLFASLNIILNIDVNDYVGFSKKDQIKDAIEMIKGIDKLNLLGIKAKINEKDYNDFMYIINPLLHLQLKLFILNHEDDKNKIKDSIGNIEFEDNTLKIKKQIESLELANNKLTETLDKNYMNMLKGIIDEEQYLRISENLKQEIESNKLNIDNLKNEQINENKVDSKKIEKYINEFLSLENPTRELIINLVEKIYIYQDKTIDIIFTFKNVT